MHPRELNFIVVKAFFFGVFFFSYELEEAANCEVYTHTFHPIFDRADTMNAQVPNNFIKDAK